MTSRDTRKPKVAGPLGTAAVLAAVLAGCAGSSGHVETSAWTPPPAPPERVEVQPAAPGSGYVWRPGHWTYEGRDYVWVPGKYVPRPENGEHWVPGYWAKGGEGGWLWIPGHWQA